MGGLGSGNHGGKLTADLCQKVDVAWMVRTERLIPGSFTSGTLSWSCGASPAGWISYEANMVDVEDAILTLRYAFTRNGERQEVVQHIRLSYTVPIYGGRRWWMHCPINGRRVGKLYRPLSGDRFAGRKAWRLAYQSQRHAPRDRPFEKLFRLQKKLGGDQGYEMGLNRPKGMWQRTFDRHCHEHDRLSGYCDAEMMRLIGLLR